MTYSEQPLQVRLKWLLGALTALLVVFLLVIVVRFREETDRLAQDDGAVSRMIPAKNTPSEAAIRKQLETLSQSASPSGTTPTPTTAAITERLNTLDKAQAGSKTPAPSDADIRKQLDALNKK